jgi:hypothetical protein
MSPKKKKNKSKPKQGWVVELKEAEREVKTANQATPDQHLRVARAHASFESERRAKLLQRTPCRLILMVHYEPNS